jgi:DNA polymerase-3 subunit gamma/tau
MRLAFVKDVLANPSTVSGGQNVQSSSVTSSVSRASMPQTFEAMADLLLYAKEGLLHGHVLHDVHLISYAPGHLVCGLSGRAPKNFGKLLKEACERITKHPWNIELRQDNSTPTIVQAKAIERENLRQQALDHPLIKEILHVFPDAKVTIN